MPSSLIGCSGHPRRTARRLSLLDRRTQTEKDDNADEDGRGGLERWGAWELDGSCGGDRERRWYTSERSIRYIPGVAGALHVHVEDPRQGCNPFGRARCIRKAVMQDPWQL
eukprot:850133-Pyramimonas_sp.AAC.1